VDKFQVLAILVSLTALCSFVNYRYIRLHTTIGVMLIALVASLVLVVLGEALGLGITSFAHRLLQQIDFNEALLRWSLGFLLFAGAMTVDAGELGRQRVPVALLATFGTAASMFIVAGLSYVALRAVGLEQRPIYCLLFGALISPTDPVAVLAIMKSAGAPKAIQTKLAGESLFNDGIGVVLFLTLLELLGDHAPHGVGPVFWLLAREVLGGALIGLLAGLLVYWMLRQVDNYHVEILLTVALAMGGYALAEALGTSAPIAAVVSGLLIGNRGSTFAMSEETRRNLHVFWELIDEILNAVLFLLIGLEVLVLPFNHRHIIAGLLIVPIVLVARWASVAGAITALARRDKTRFGAGTIRILTWGGLRGGLAVAMALALPAGPQRNTILAITYGVVIFSIAVQGTTIKGVVRRASGASATIR
jgi:CPA1 family monovalent cation:H+ antiporter